MRKLTYEEVIRNFFAKISPNPTGCWIWKGAINRDGYGHFSVHRKPLRAHRFSYELFNKPISSELHVDHLCRVRNCVNPNHLEAVTGLENFLRGKGLAKINMFKTHCKNGHEFTPDNLYFRNRPRGGRICKKCIYIRSEKYKSLK